jgi:osmotically-inducible protein OsmY
LAPGLDAPHHAVTLRKRWATRPNHSKENSMKTRQFFPIAMLAVAASVMTLAGCSTGPKQASAGQYIDDTAITGKVKAAIFNDPALKSAEINVETFKGAVQLSGFVNSQADIQRAVAVAQGVSGVTSVKNDMRLKK